MRRVIGIFVTACVLAVLYWRVDVQALREQLAGADPAWIALALALFVPQVWVAALRWRLLVRRATALSVLDAVRQVLAANALNLVLPSKLGDLARGAAGAGDAERIASRTGRAVFEKLLDLLALSLWAVVAAGVAPPTAGGTIALAVAVAVAAASLAAIGLALGGVRHFKLQSSPEERLSETRDLPRRRLKCEVPDPSVLATRIGQVLWGVRQAGRECGSNLGQGIEVFGLTGLLWAMHLTQIDCFFRAMGGTAGWAATFLLVPGALLVGLLPGSVCGLGPRDSALVLLFAGVEPAPRVAGVGLLLMLRYLVPGLAGLPFLSVLTPGARRCETH